MKGLVVLSLAAGAALAQTPSNVPSDSAIKQLLVNRIDNERQGVGIVVGVIDPKGRRIVSHGTVSRTNQRRVDGDTPFEIGSITKVFTSLLLADMVAKGEVALDDPVAKYLPAGTKVPERNGKQITLRHLAMHTSGLGRDPSNLPSKDASRPYAGFTVEQLYQYLATTVLASDPGERYAYSNAAGGLLGVALARRANADYETLVRRRILEPLGMGHTFITFPSSDRARVARGHNGALDSVPDIETGALASAGALWSTANDMLIFLGANLGLSPSPLSTAMKSMLADMRSTDSPNIRIALGWHVGRLPTGDMPWHNGGTIGFRSFAAYEPGTQTGLVVLSNTNTPAGVDDIGVHLLYPPYPLAAPPKQHKQIAIDAKLLDGYLGKFALAPTFVITVTREGDRLFLQATNQPKFEAFPEGSRDFFLKGVDAQITFDVDGTGRAVALILHQNGAHQRAGRVE